MHKPNFKIYDGAARGVFVASFSDAVAAAEYLIQFPSCYLIQGENHA